MIADAAFDDSCCRGVWT